MRSHPLRPSGLRSLVLGCLGLVVLSGCTTAEGETARTEPWQKDELALSRSTLSLVRFRAAPDQALAFVVKNKQGTVQGRVPLR